MSGMHDKKLRFNIQFCKTDPTHLQVAELLNSKARGEKAKYIVNAVHHYERSFGISANNMTLTNEKYIEAVVNRVLLERETGSAGILPNTTSSRYPQPVEDNESDDDTELGEQELNIIANSLNSLENLRKNR